MGALPSGGGAREIRSFRGVAWLAELSTKWSRTLATGPLGRILWFFRQRRRICASLAAENRRQSDGPAGRGLDSK